MVIAVMFTLALHCESSLSWIRCCDKTETDTSCHVMIAQMMSSLYLSTIIDVGAWEESGQGGSTHEGGLRFRRWVRWATLDGRFLCVVELAFKGVF